MAMVETFHHDIFYLGCQWSRAGSVQRLQLEKDGMLPTVQVYRSFLRKNGICRVQKHAYKTLGVLIRQQDRMV